MLSLNARQIVRQQLQKSAQDPIPSYTPRRLYQRSHLPGKVTAVVGMRRAGKTTFLQQVRTERTQQGARLHHLPFFSFEDERLADIDVLDLQTIVDEYESLVPDSRHHHVTWCFDEIQRVKGWEQFVRRLLDSGHVDVFVSGSSAALLSREIATSLRGRGWQVLIHPFSFVETLLHHVPGFTVCPEQMTASESLQAEAYFREWLDVGGFPEAQSLDVATRFRLLRDYVDIATLRDIVERHNVSNIVGLNYLTRHLLGNPGSMFSIEKFYRTLRSQGLSVGKDTLHDLFGYLQDCYLIRSAWIAADSERKRFVNPRKIYPSDTGLIQVFNRWDRSGLGHALESAVYVELERRGCEVNYVRTNGNYEVDFLARYPAGALELIQVCADLTDVSTAKREIRALQAARDRFPDARRRVLTYSRQHNPSLSADDVVIQPAYEWMLMPPA